MNVTWLKIIIFFITGFGTFESSNLDQINGLNFVAPPNPFPQDPMIEVQNVNANWIAVIPYASSRLGIPRVRHNLSNYQWWGETPTGVIETIHQAQAKGIRIMLKPQVYVHGSWPGAIDFTSQEDWEAWEASYYEYIMTYAHIADSMDIDLLCIGTELRISAIKRPFFWKNLVQEIETFFDGKLTYAANWDDYESILFWQDLHYIGIDAYFPLDDAKTPSVKDLVKSWNRISKNLEDFSIQQDRSILFTEYGYLSVDYCANKNWELEKILHDLDVNEQAQANSLEALFRTFYSQDFWAGGFLWKWFPNMEGHEGYPSKDYTPQGKMAESVVKSWYGR